VLLKLFGDYGTQIRPDELMLKSGGNGGNATPGLAKLRGKRLVVASELPEGRQLDEGMVKQATGQDVIVARHLYQNEFEYVPNFKLVMVGNHQPYVRGTDYGIWRRMCLVPFEAKIPEERRDKGLPEKLMHELPGILNWALEGTKARQQQGLSGPAKVQDATNSYQTEQDVVEAWLDECCIRDPLTVASTRRLHGSYTDWAKETGEWEMSQRKFAQKLREKGFEAYRTNKERVFNGLAFVPDVDADF
jgi:putative DNA primase/helicase